MNGCSRCNETDPNCYVCHEKPEPETDTMKHYIPTFDAASNSWGYTTPTGGVDQIQSKGVAIRWAEAQRLADIETAEVGVGPFAALYANYFKAQGVMA